MLALVAATTWPDVALALIAALPGLTAAIAALLIRRDIKTPSGRPLGKLTEDNTHVSLANYYRLHKLTEGGAMPPGYEPPPAPE